MKRFFFFTVLCLFLASGLLAQSKGGKPKLVIEQETFDAGDVFRTVKTIEHAFKVKNAGDADLNILSATPG